MWQAVFERKGDFNPSLRKKKKPKKKNKNVQEKWVGFVCVIQVSLCLTLHLIDGKDIVRYCRNNGMRHITKPFFVPCKFSLREEVLALTNCIYESSFPLCPSIHVFCQVANCSHETPITTQLFWFGSIGLVYLPLLSVLLSMCFFWFLALQAIGLEWTEERPPPEEKRQNYHFQALFSSRGFWGTVCANCLMYTYKHWCHTRLPYSPFTISVHCDLIIKKKTTCIFMFISL